MRKIFLLTSFILFLCFSGAAWSQTPVRDVNVVNHSFELDADGNQVCGHTGDLGIGWYLSGNWIGQDVPCWTPYFCMDCDPEDPEQEGGACNCKTWPASDGWVMSYMQTNDIYFEQILNETIHARTMYTLKMDAMTWDPDVCYTASVVYMPPGGTPTIVVSKDIWLEEAESVETAEWKEYSVVLVVPDGHPSIGSDLGVRFFSHAGEDNWRWPFIDNIRVQAQLATDAYFPTPEDEAINVRLDTTHLKWYPGLWTPSGDHDVYFGTSFEEVDEADTGTSGVYKGRQDANSWEIDTELQIGKEYFWRIDEYNDSFVPNPLDPNSPPASPWRGHVWSFKMNDGKAFNFNPPDEGEMVAVDADFQWEAGIAAEWHDVYFSSNFDDVNNRALDCLMSATQPLADTTYSPYADDGIVLVLGKTYYWAVDEFNSTTTGSPWESDVLSFRAADYHVVDDFDSYADTEELTAVWRDGYDNYSGSEIATETAIVRDGTSLKFYYDNQTFWPDCYSEIDADVADLGFGPNWTANSAEALVLWFCGSVFNRVSSNDRMYVGLEDSRGASSYAEVRYPGDMNNILLATWQEWNIDLDDFAGIDQTNVSKIYVGFGDRETPVYGEFGIVYFEDFRLYPTRCAPVMAWGMGSLDDDCVVEYDDLGIMGDQWLLEAKGVVTPEAVSTLPIIWYKLDDLSGSTKPTTTLNSGSFGTGWNGTFGPLPHDPEWVTTGKVEDALKFDNDADEGDYVSFKALNLNSNTVTITAWIRRQPVQSIYPPVVFTRGSDALGTTTTVGLGLGSTGDDGNPAWAVNNELCYHWADAENSWSWHTGLIVPESTWTFVALTVAPDEAMLYMSDGTVIEAVSNYATHAPEAFDGKMYLSWDTIDVNVLDPDSHNDRHFNGSFDEVRIYNYTLTPGQILTVAGLTGSHYIPFESWRPDLVSDDVINFKDYDILADNWLQEVLWP